MGPCGPVPMRNAELVRSTSVTYRLAATTASYGALPLASSAAIAEANVHPVPCVLRVLQLRNHRAVSRSKGVVHRGPHPGAKKLRNHAMGLRLQFQPPDVHVAADMHIATQAVGTGCPATGTEGRRGRTLQRATR
jgi:hypothetical protein